jgi:hypothetical protein
LGGLIYEQAVPASRPDAADYQHAVIAHVVVLVQPKARGGFLLFVWEGPG